jgi:hypothetical protein
LPTYNRSLRNMQESRYNLTHFLLLNLAMCAKFAKSRTQSPFILTEKNRSHVSENSLGPQTTLQATRRLRAVRCYSLCLTVDLLSSLTWCNYALRAHILKN